MAHMGTNNKEKVHVGFKPTAKPDIKPTCDDFGG